MPFFETTPTVFPRVIPPCGPLGDIPTFAFALADAVVAWTPPAGFPEMRDDHVVLQVFRPDPACGHEHMLHDHDDHVARVRVAARVYLADEFEDWWKVTLDRLHVVTGAVH